MPAPPHHRTAAPDDSPAGSPHWAAPGLPEPQLPVFRFGLRQMFLFVTVVSILLGGLLLAPGPGYAPLVWLLAAMVVLFHVTGTAIGSRLRAHTVEREAWHAAQSLPATSAQPRGDPPNAATSLRSPLHKRGLSLRWLPWCIAAGAVGGGLAGAAILAVTVGQRSTGIGVAVGAVSTAVLGGWFAFLAANLWAILRHGLRDAVTAHHSDQRRKRLGR